MDLEKLNKKFLEIPMNSVLGFGTAISFDKIEAFLTDATFDLNIQPIGRDFGVTDRESFTRDDSKIGDRRVECGG